MKRIIKIILFLLVMISFLSLAKALFLDIYQDFNYYYFASLAAFQHINPYLAGGPYTGYIYPPVCLIFLYPFQLLPLAVAVKLWIGLSVIGIVFSLIVLLRLCKQSFFSLFSLIILFLAFLFFPFKFTLGMGQINIVILVGLVLALYYFVKGKEVLSGAFFGLTITIKYFPLFLIFYLILRRKWKMLGSLFATVFFLMAAGFLFIDPQINHYFFTQTFPSLLQSTGGYYYNQALSGFLSRTVIDPSVTFYLRIVLSLIILFITFFVLYKKRKINKNVVLFEIGIIITVSLLLNSFTWQHHFTWLLIPLIFTAVIIQKKSEYVLLFVIFLLLTFNLKSPAGVPALLQSHAFYGALLLWGFDLYLLHKTNFEKIKEKV